MYSTSLNFQRAVQESGRRKTVVDILYNGQLVTGATDLAVTSGSIRVDSTAGIRRTGTIVVADPTLVPTLSTSVLSPLGTEVRVRQGIVFPNGDQELVPLGIFPLEVTSWSDATGSVPTLTLFDRSKNLDRGTVGVPWSYSGWMASAAILDWMTRGMPFVNVLPFDPLLIDYLIPGGQLINGGSHWKLISDIARGMGGIAQFDVNGNFFVKPIKVLDASYTSNNAVWTIGSGAGGVMVSTDRQISRENVYNRIHVFGAAQANGIIPYGDAFNNDPASPARYTGPLGYVSKRIDDNTLTTNSQCIERAIQELALSTQLSTSLDFTAVPNPALDVDDIILVKFRDGTQELHQLASLTIPLGSGTFSGTSRSQLL